MDPKPKETSAPRDDSALLDYFAAAALPTVLQGDHSAKHDHVAEQCYRLADAMVALKKKRTPPVLESLQPATAAIGEPSFDLHVIGKGFTKESQILWNGLPEPTTFVSETELTTGVNMDTAEVAIEIPVAVLNGNTGSNVLPFTLTGASRKRGPGADKAGADKADDKDKAADKAERGEQRAEAGRR